MRHTFACLAAALALSACAKDAEMTAIGGSVGQEINRTGCPAVAIPAETGDVTLFNPPASRDARAIDVEATLTELKGNCDTTQPANLITTATFRIDARRSTADGPRDLVLPYFAVVMRGGDQVVSKSQSQVLVHFDAGKLTASATGQASATIDRSQAILPQAIQDRIGRKRKAEDADASLDPMNDPSVRAALAKASFELLVGLQLTTDQLAYNATR